MAGQKLVIFRNISGILCVTTEENYHRRKVNIHWVRQVKWAKKPVDIVNWYVKAGLNVPGDFTMAPDPLRTRRVNA